MCDLEKVSEDVEAVLQRVLWGYMNMQLRWTRVLHLFTLSPLRTFPPLSS